MVEEELEEDEESSMRRTSGAVGEEEVSIVEIKEKNSFRREDVPGRK